jgi:dTDP-4-dehydrorhamnose reductase
MRVLILGGSGMLGHKLSQQLSSRFDAYTTFRSAPVAYDRLNIAHPDRSLRGVVAEDFDSVTRALAAVRPDVVVNCIGIVKQDAAAKDPITSITVNSLFPHLLARACRQVDARLIHVSTDCVFSGQKGCYVETDFPDADDLYGRTKFLGEVDGKNCLTIRTSIIGRELGSRHGLLEWFLSQQGGRVRGFKRAVFSGFTTDTLANVIATLIKVHPALSGTWHVASEPINKFDLLSLIKSVYRLNIDIDADDTFVCDRSLDGSRFLAETNIAAPSWPEMIRRMHEDATPYDEFRG